jgi:hypothetical protein
MEFARHVRATLLAERPATVAVELPADLEHLYLRAVDRLPQMSVIAAFESSLSLGAEEQDPIHLPVEPADPFIEALRTAREIEARILFLEPPSKQRPHIAGAYSAASSPDLIGAARYIELYRLHPVPRTPELEGEAAALAWKLQGADPFETTAVVVSLNVLDPLLDAMEVPQEEPPAPPVRLFRQSELFNLHPDCLAEVTTEAPFYQERYETLRDNIASASIARPAWQLSLLREAEAEYILQTGDEIRAWQRITLAKFARNLALLEQELLPGAYELTLAARSVVDDNFGYEVWQMANRYSVQQTEDPPLETIRISGDTVWQATRKLRIRRQLPRMKQRLKPSGLRERKREKFKGEWAQQTTGNSICSYPAEDFVIENYGRFLKSYAKNLLTSERSRVEEFLASTRDGIDLRETLRNWHTGKLFVREVARSSADVGALVVIFDEDRSDRYRYLTTWLGEHQNESDMAFYSTEPFEHLVGPGIGRAEYGGLLMTLPPRRMYDVWNDPDYDEAETKAERLLMAAIDYSVEHHIVYVAAKPPRSKFRTLAARANRKLVYIPLGQLSPTKLKKIRVVHVLDSYKRRADAKQYIW